MKYKKELDLRHVPAIDASLSQKSEIDSACKLSGLRSLFAKRNNDISYIRDEY